MNFALSKEVLALASSSSWWPCLQRPSVACTSFCGFLVSSLLASFLSHDFGPENLLLGQVDNFIIKLYFEEMLIVLVFPKDQWVETPLEEGAGAWGVSSSSKPLPLASVMLASMWTELCLSKDVVQEFGIPGVRGFGLTWNQGLGRCGWLTLEQGVGAQNCERMSSVVLSQPSVGHSSWQPSETLGS